MEPWSRLSKATPRAASTLLLGTLQIHVCLLLQATTERLECKCTARYIIIIILDWLVNFNRHQMVQRNWPKPKTADQPELHSSFNLRGSRNNPINRSIPFSYVTQHSAAIAFPRRTTVMVMWIKKPMRDATLSVGNKCLWRHGYGKGFLECTQPPLFVWATLHGGWSSRWARLGWAG